MMPWHGRADISLPVRIAREMAKELRRADLQEYEGEMRLGLFRRYGGEMLKCSE